MDPRAKAHVFALELDTAAAWEDPAAFADPGLAAVDAAVDAAAELAPQAGLLESLLAAFDPGRLAYLEETIGHLLGDAEAHAHIDHDTMAQLEQLQELQSMQQNIAMMSQMNAMSHETSMAIINNIGDSGPDYNGNGFADWSEG